MRAGGAKFGRAKYPAPPLIGGFWREKFPKPRTLETRQSAPERRGFPRLADAHRRKQCMKISKIPC
jgi:hypothetical protein